MNTEFPSIEAQSAAANPFAMLLSSSAPLDAHARMSSQVLSATVYHPLEKPPLKGADNGSAREVDSMAPARPKAPRSSSRWTDGAVVAGIDASRASAARYFG
jgi:hypothetical protein